MGILRIVSLPNSYLTSLSSEALLLFILLTFHNHFSHSIILILSPEIPKHFYKFEYLRYDPNHTFVVPRISK